MRSRTLRTVMIGLVALLGAGIGFAKDAHAGQSAVGTWKLNVHKSSFGDMTAPKFEQLAIMTDEPNAVKWSLKGITADGKSYIASYDGPVDGQDHHMMSNEAASTVAYTRTGSTLQWVTKDKSGTVIETASGMLSPDGKTLTLKGTVQGPKGASNFVSVFDRVQ